MSITIHPFEAAIGAKCFDVSAPAEKSAKSNFSSNEESVSSLTIKSVFKNFNLVPADFLEENKSKNIDLERFNNFVNEFNDVKKKNNLELGVII